MTAPAIPTEDQRPLSRKEKGLATTQARGKSLFADGYEIFPPQPGDPPGVYIVQTPPRVDKKTGEVYRLQYEVDYTHGECRQGTEPCPAFANFDGQCKHLIAVTKIVDNARRLLGPMIPPVLSHAPETPEERRAWFEKARREDF